MAVTGDYSVERTGSCYWTQKDGHIVVGAHFTVGYIGFEKLVAPMAYTVSNSVNSLTFSGSAIVNQQQSIAVEGTAVSGTVFGGGKSIAIRFMIEPTAAQSDGDKSDNSATAIAMIPGGIPPGTPTSIGCANAT